MKYAIWVLWAAGLALAIWLLVREGAADIALALAGAGWGVAAVAAFHVLPLAADGMGWRALVPADSRPSPAMALWNRWVGESVNGLLPVAQLGGEVARVRVAVLGGMSGGLATATVIADLTLGTFSQVVFSIAGLALLLSYGAPGMGAVWLIGAMAVIAAGVAGFVLVQRRGLFTTLVAVGRRLVPANGALARWDGAASLDGALRAAYRPGPALAAFVWRSVGWLLGTGEIWLALHFLGHPVTVLDAMMMESLVQAVRSAGFLVPAGLGLQEGAFLLLGGVVGAGPDVALAAALIRRAREIGLGVPGLIAWHVVEGRRLLARRT